jgi:hypothetical protein
MPDLVANREIVTTHQINIDVEPTEIVWSKRELDVEERKDSSTDAWPRLCSRL